MSTAFEQLQARDRSVQAEAVRALIEAPEHILPPLTDLWTKSDRFDVKLHIARALAGRGLIGLSGLLALAGASPGTMVEWEEDLLVASLSSFGYQSVEWVIREIELGRIRRIHILPRVLKRSDADPAPYWRRLLWSVDPEIRRRATMYANGFLSASELATIFVRHTHEALARAGDFCDPRGGFVHWTREDRAKEPRLFREYSAIVRGVLLVENDQLVSSAATDICNNGICDPLTIRNLLDASRNDTLGSWTRASAMRALLGVHPQQSHAVEEVIRMVPQCPIGACIALASIDATLIPDWGIQVIIDAIPKAGDREGNYAQDLIATRNPLYRRVRIGARALPGLLASLESTDAQTVSCSASTLGMLGPLARPAIPRLLQTLREQESARDNPEVVAALIAIDPDHSRVQEAVIGFIRSYPQNGASSHVVRQAFEQLTGCRPNAEWSRQLVREALQSPKHAQFRYAVWSNSPELPAALGFHRDMLLTQLREPRRTSVETWDAEDSRDTLSRLEARRLAQEHAETAARLLRRCEPLSDAIVDALLDAVCCGSFPASAKWPSGDQPQRLEPAQSASTEPWQFDSVAVAAINSLAHLAHRHPEILAKCLTRLGSYPAQLVALLVQTSSEDHADTPLSCKLPGDTPAEIVELVVRSLLEVADRPSPHRGDQAMAIRALARLPQPDARCLSWLVRIALHGAGTGGPPAALAAIGWLRPVRPECVHHVEDHIMDPRMAMREAAVLAARRLETSAISLIPQLAALGLANLRTSIGYSVADALQAIAPDDPIVQDYLDRHRNAVRR